MSHCASASDVLIVGGGPAGLATALALRQRGASVTVVDAQVPPIDKACGEGLMPDSLADLAALGVELQVGDGAEFGGIRFVNHRLEKDGRGDVATARFPVLAGRCSGVGVRRQVLHGRMVEAATAAGVVLRWGVPVVLIVPVQPVQPIQLVGSERRGQVLLGGQKLDFDYLVGADGQSSQIRRWAGLEKGSETSRRFGFRKHFQVEPWSEFVEVHWGRSGQAYVTPISLTEVCVAGVVRDSHCRLDTLLSEMPELARRLGAAKEAGPERGAVTTSRRFRHVASGRVALVGDASGSADAITGEGMGLAFRQAHLLADCLAAGKLDRYNQRHPSTLTLAHTMARVMLWMDQSARLRDRAIAMLAAQPEMFSRLLGVHLGEESLSRFVRERGVELAWRMAVPPILDRRKHSFKPGMTSWERLPEDVLESSYAGDGRNPG